MNWKGIALLTAAYFLGSIPTAYLTGRWLLWPSRANLWLTERLLRPLFEEPLPPADGGSYIFFVARRDE